MILNENWAVSPERVQAFFGQLPGATETSDGFLINDCAIHLTATESTLMGKWPTVRTLVYIEGPDDAVKALYRQFFLHFLSAGG